MISKSYNIENDRAFSAAINRTIAVVSDIRLELGLIAKDWRNQNKANFILIGNGKYTPLTPKYLERKTTLAGLKLPILVGAKKGHTKNGRLISGGGESGRLRDSVTGNGTKDSILVIGKTAMIMGTSVDYASYVQDKRKFIFVDDYAVKRWVDILAVATAGKVK